MSWLTPAALRDLAEHRWGHRSTWKCVYCGRSAPDGAVDHFIPRERGGTDLPWNLVPACGSCNSSKKHRDGVEWMTAVGVTPSTIAALRTITRSPDWQIRAADYRYPRLVTLDYSAAKDLWDQPKRPLLLPNDLGAVFTLDAAAWSPVTALRREAADYLAALDRPALSSQQLNRDFESRGLTRTVRKGVHGYRGFRVDRELREAGRFAAGDEATTAARRAERNARKGLQPWIPLSKTH